jgi:hypothetical protein
MSPAGTAPVSRKTTINPQPQQIATALSIQVCIFKGSSGIAPQHTTFPSKVKAADKAP